MPGLPKDPRRENQNPVPGDSPDPPNLIEWGSGVKVPERGTTFLNHCGRMIYDPFLIGFHRERVEGHRVALLSDVWCEKNGSTPEKRVSIPRAVGTLPRAVGRSKAVEPNPDTGSCNSCFAYEDTCSKHTSVNASRLRASSFGSLICGKSFPNSPANTETEATKLRSSC